MKYVLLIFLVSMVSCTTTKSIYISENLSDENTLLIKENTEDEWVSLAEGIEGFEHQSGVLQKVEVQIDVDKKYHLNKIIYKETKKSKMNSISGQWKVIKIIDINELQSAPTLKIENGTISGNAGCNKYSANYAITDNTISISKSMSTKMYCQNMKVEKAFFACLKAANSFELKDGHLSLIGADNQVLMTCKK